MKKVFIHHAGLNTLQTKRITPRDTAAMHAFISSFPDLLEIEMLLYQNYPREEQGWEPYIKNRDRNGYTMLGLWQGPAIVGYIETWEAHPLMDDPAKITAMLIRHDYRRLNLADRLYDAAKKYLCSIGFDGDATLYIARKNKASAKAAIRNGFRICEQNELGARYIGKLA